MKLWSRTASTLLLVAGLSAGQTAPANNSSKAPAISGGGSAQSSAQVSAGTDPAARYILGANDVVQVNVWHDANLSNVYTVGPDGRMSISLIGEFNALGLTISQLQDLITEKLRGFINEPIVNVQLLRNNSKKYTVIGGVMRGGTFPLLQATTVLDALASCDGFKEFAKKTRIVVMRGTAKFPFNYNDVVRGRHMEQNIKLQDGDTIVVPEQ